MALDTTQVIDILGTANTMSFPLPGFPLLGGIKAGGVATVLATNPVGRMVGQMGLKLAAAGGNLQKGIFVWETPGADQTVTKENRDEAGKLLSLSLVTTRGVTQNRFFFHMNPESISESLAPEWAEIKAPGQNRPIYQFVHGGARELAFTLHFFYGLRDRAHIQRDLGTLRSLTQRPLRQAQAGDLDVGALGKAPLLYFYFGKYIQGERFLVKSLKLEASKLFDPLTLLPMYATVEVTLAHAPESHRPQGGGPNNVSLKTGRGDIRDVLGKAF